MSNYTVAYVRVSTEKQLDGNGPEQQRMSICAWAAMNGCQIDDWVYEDESGMVEDREAIVRLLEQASKGRLQRLVFDRVDRLGRRLAISESLFDKFTTAGVDMICVQQKFENNSAGILMRQIMGALAEYSRSEWLKRMRACRIAVDQRGHYSGGKMPYGYRTRGKGQLEVDPDTAPVVRKVFACKDQRKMNLVETAAELARAGHLTSTGKPISPKQISKILARRDFYAARAPLHKIDLKHGAIPQHPPLIDMEAAAMHGYQTEAVMETSS